jgi:micrococcal nuclease
MQFNAKTQKLIKTHLKIINVVDGDGMIVEDIFTKEQEEIRLLGIDAPEIKRCRKLKQDEKMLRMPGELLMHLGRISHKYLIDIARRGESVTIAQEKGKEQDFYGRTLAYVYLKDGSCVNEQMIKEGYAKPFDEYPCEELQEYLKLNTHAMKSKRGLYKIVSNF